MRAATTIELGSAAQQDALKSATERTWLLHVPAAMLRSRMSSSVRWHSAVGCRVVTVTSCRSGCRNPAILAGGEGPSTISCTQKMTPKVGKVILRDIQICLS
jgi:hypothetical protein